MSEAPGLLSMTLGMTCFSFVPVVLCLSTIPIFVAPVWLLQIPVA